MEPRKAAANAVISTGTLQTAQGSGHGPADRNLQPILWQTI